MQLFIMSKEPYVSKQEMEKMWEKERDSKIIAHKTFRTFAKTDTPKDANLLIDKPLSAIQSSRFRDQDKSKWVGSGFRFQ